MLCQVIRSRRWFTVSVLIGWLSWIALAEESSPTRLVTAQAAVPADVHRSPVDLVLSGDSTWLVTVNQTAGSVSLVDLAEGRVLDESVVGDRPVAVARCLDGQHVVVTVSGAGDVVLLEVREGRLLTRGRMHTGFYPHGLAVTADGRCAYVALSAADEVVLLDLKTQQVVRRIAVGRQPRFLALSPDDSRLAVGAAGDGAIGVVDTLAGAQRYVEKISGINIGQLQTSRDGLFVYFPSMVYQQNPITDFNIKQGWVLASRLARVRLDGPARREAVSLDPPGEAIADPHGLALSHDEQFLVASAGGTHELLFYRLPDLPFAAGGGGDHIDRRLLADREQFSRLELGGRPLGLRIDAQGRRVYVANYLRDSVQVVDMAGRKLMREIALGGPLKPSLARRGEAVFYDARFSLDQWYSCHSCHQDGGSNAEPMDTMNDGTQFTLKTVLPLYNVHATSPWTWHGWQADLRDAMHKSITVTMRGKPPTEEHVDALLAFLKTLQPPTSPYRLPDGGLSAAARRGREVFSSQKAQCSSCHQQPLFTDGEIHDVGSGRKSDPYQGFNTPSLLGVWAKTSLLHDGRAKSLEELLTGPHNPAQVAGEGELTEQERKDLIEYLKSL